ncbi:ROK family protein [Sporosarcina sp. Te-1]|uniref:ROK family protein n=1 Tax=Sporosarcina sp. Te-1 TaxID=2818390 RepID=UPI001A9DA724|nr:ROK family protein [Sporosarcina sp. Te-1]QTD40973.1 ROK family protein [Sporosarcina sp. Te-1]
MGYRLVADIGGTKLAASLMTTDGIVMGTVVEPTEKDDPEKLFTLFITACDELCTRAGLDRSAIEGIAVGLPGIVDCENGIAVYQNNLPWHGFPIKDRLTELYPAAEIEIDNDVYMAAWGEYRQRCYNRETFVYLTLSTGISCAIIHEGKFMRGAGMAGEIGFGHVGEDTLETHVSGPSMERKGQSVFQNEELSLKAILDLYYKEDARAGAIIEEAVRALAGEVHHTLLLLDPHTIVLGGGVFNNHPSLVEAVRRELRSHLQHPLFQGKENRIEASHFKGEAGLWGAFHRLARRESRLEIVSDL